MSLIKYASLKETLNILLIEINSINKFNRYYISKLSPKCELLSVNKQYLGMHYVHIICIQFKYVVNSIYKHYILKAIKII